MHVTIQFYLHGSFAKPEICNTEENVTFTYMLCRKCRINILSQDSFMRDCFLEQAHCVVQKYSIYFKKRASVILTSVCISSHSPSDLRILDLLPSVYLLLFE